MYPQSVFTGDMNKEQRLKRTIRIAFYSPMIIIGIIAFIHAVQAW